MQMRCTYAVNMKSDGLGSQARACSQPDNLLGSVARSGTPINAKLLVEPYITLSRAFLSRYATRVPQTLSR